MFSNSAISRVHSHRFGGKHVLGLGMLLATIATILIPVAARTHVYLVIILRVIMGLGMVCLSQKE